METKTISIDLFIDSADTRRRRCYNCGCKRYLKNMLAFASKDYTSILWHCDNHWQCRNKKHSLKKGSGGISI